MVGLRPIKYRIHDIFSHHGPLAGQVAAAAGTVGHLVVGPAAVPVAGHGALQVAVAVVGVVVHHVHHHAQPGAVQRGHHGAALPHAHLAVERVGGEAALGHIVVLGVVAPVVAAVGAGFVHGLVVENGLQLHVADAQIFQVVQAGGVHAVAVQRGVPGYEAHEFAAVFGGHTAVFVGGKVRHVYLPHAAGVGRDDRALVLGPALGGRGIQVQHHGALPVGPGRAGVGVNGIGGAAVVELQVVEVVGVFPVAGKRQAPHAVPLPLQMMCAQVVGVWLGVGAGGKQLHRDGRRRGGPQLKGGSRRRVVGTQVGAVIVRQFAGLLPIHVQSLLKIVQDIFIIPDSPPVRNRFRAKALTFCRVLGSLAVESGKHFCSYKV